MMLHFLIRQQSGFWIAAQAVHRAMFKLCLSRTTKSQRHQNSKEYLWLCDFETLWFHSSWI